MCVLCFIVGQAIGRHASPSVAESNVDPEEQTRMFMINAMESTQVRVWDCDVLLVEMLLLC